MKKIIYTLPLMVLIAAGCSVQQSTSQNQQPNNSVTSPSSTENSQTSSELKFSGIIQEIKNEQPFDGPLSLKVDGKWVIIDGGLTPATSDKGVVSGLNLNALESNVGTRVEVYAEKTDDGNLSILSSRKYYVRALR